MSQLGKSDQAELAHWLHLSQAGPTEAPRIEP